MLRRLSQIFTTRTRGCNSAPLSRRSTTRPISRNSDAMTSMRTTRSFNTPPQPEPPALPVILRKQTKVRLAIRQCEATQKTLRHEHEQLIAWLSRHAHTATPQQRSRPEATERKLSLALAAEVERAVSLARKLIDLENQERVVRERAAEEARAARQPSTPRRGKAPKRKTSRQRSGGKGRGRTLSF